MAHYVTETKRLIARGMGLDSRYYGGGHNGVLGYDGLISVEATSHPFAERCRSWHHRWILGISCLLVPR